MLCTYIPDLAVFLGLRAFYTYKQNKERLLIVITTGTFPKQHVWEQTESYRNEVHCTSQCVSLSHTALIGFAFLKILLRDELEFMHTAHSQSAIPMPSLTCLVYFNKNLTGKVSPISELWCTEQRTKKKTKNTHSVEWNSPDTRYMSIKCSARYLTLIVCTHKLLRVQFISYNNIWRRNASWFRYCF